MEPEPPHAIDRNAGVREMAPQMLGHHRTDLVRDLPPVLAEEQLVGRARRLFAAIQEPGIVADVVREPGHEPRPEDLPRLSVPRVVRRILALEQDGGTCVAEDEMELPELEVGMPGGQLRIQHEGAARMTAAQRVDDVLDRERRRGAGDVHVVGEAPGPERGLDLDRDRRIRTLQVRAADDDRVDVGSAPAGPGEGLAGGSDADLGLERELLLAALSQAGPQPRRVEDPLLVDHVAVTHAGGAHDELRGGHVAGGELAAGDLVGVLVVPAQRRRRQRGHELVVGHAVGRREESGRGEDDAGQRGSFTTAAGRGGAAAGDHAPGHGRGRRRIRRGAASGPHDRRARPRRARGAAAGRPR